MIKRKHIIFDMDGTLTDTATATAAAIAVIEKRRRLPRVTNADIIAAMGIAGLDFYKRLYPHVRTDILVQIEPEIDDQEEAEIRKIGKKILFPGVGDTLLRLSKENCFLYLASTGSKEHVCTVLSSTGIGRLFTSVSFGEPEKTAMVKNILAGRNPEEWCLVGDMHKDSDAAHANHIFALGAGYGYLTDESIHLFDAILYKPGDIFKYISLPNGFGGSIGNGLLRL